MKRLERLHKHANKLEERIQKSLITKTSNNNNINTYTSNKITAKKWHMGRAFRKLHIRIKNLVKDFHYKFAKWLCINYEIILLPEFRTKSMVQKKREDIITIKGNIPNINLKSINKQEYNRTINGTVARQMLTWSHYKFKQRLLHKSTMFTNCKVIIVNEAHTTKTCGMCGIINNNVGSSEVFKCVNPTCKFIMDRDIQGARNIYLRYLTTLTKEKLKLTHSTNNNNINNIN